MRERTDGTSEDVTDHVELTESDPNDVITIDRTGAETLVRANQVGKAVLVATLDGLTTRQPLSIEVVDSETRQATLRVLPDPLRIAVGKSRGIDRAEVVPGPGIEPVEMPVRFEAKNDATMTVDADRSKIRGLAPGRSSVTVVPVDTSGKYRDLRSVLLVEVYDGGADKGKRRLVLDGPARTSVGAAIPLSAELLNGAEAGRDVTPEARFSLAPGEEGMATLLPGGRLVAKQAGLVHVTASLGDLASNVHEVRIDPPASTFSKIVLVMDPAPMSLGQVRNFTVWGEPRDGGPRQDLTELTGESSDDESKPRLSVTSTVEGNPVPLKLRRAGTLVSVAVGTARVQSTVGDKLLSEPVEIRVAPELGQPIAIRIEPRGVARSRTATTPITFRVSARHAGSVDFQEVTGAKIESLDATILAPVEGEPAQFRAVREGTVQVRATLGEFSDLAEVRITADRFETVVPTLAEVKQNDFNFDLAVTGGRINEAEDLEYRVVSDPNAPGDVPWTAATVTGGRVSCQLTSPFIPLVSRQQLYRVFIQARDRKVPDKIEVYPCWVKFDLSKAR